MTIDNLEAKIDLFLATKREEIVKHIIRLVNIESVSGEPAGGKPFGTGCANALDAALEIGTKLGFTSKNYDYYCGSLRYEAGEEEIGIFCHLDVVPPGNNWNYDPFNAVEENGYIIGRGTNDDKGPAIAGLYTMLCFKELGIPLKHSLRLVLGCSEECGMEDLQHYIAVEPKLPVFSIVPDAEFPVCYAEKGILAVTVQSPALAGNILDIKGGIVSNMVPDNAYAILQNIDLEQAVATVSPYGLKAEKADNGVRITASGKATHAAWPEGSENAIGVLCRGLSQTSLVEPEERQVLQHIADFLADYYGESLGIAAEDEVTGKLTHIAGLFNRLGNGALELNFNIRFPISVQAAELFEAVTRKVQACSFSVTDTSLSSPRFMDPKLPIVQKLTDIYNRIAEDNAKPYYEGGATYARLLPNAVAYGPHFPRRVLPFEEGRGKEHMPDECVEIQNILDSIKIYVLAIMEIDQTF